MDNIYEKYRGIFWEVFSRYDLDVDGLNELESTYVELCKAMEKASHPDSYVRHMLNRRARSLMCDQKHEEARIIPMIWGDKDTEYASLVRCCVSALQEMLETLTPQQGLVIAMHYGLGDYRQMTTNEIAAALNISRHMVEVTEYRAMVRLRKNGQRAKLEGLLSIFAEQPMYMLEVR